MPDARGIPVHEPNDIQARADKPTPRIISSRVAVAEGEIRSLCVSSGTTSSTASMSWSASANVSRLTSWQQTSSVADPSRNFAGSSSCRRLPFSPADIVDALTGGIGMPGCGSPGLHPSPRVHLFGCPRPYSTHAPPPTTFPSMQSDMRDRGPSHGDHDGVLLGLPGMVNPWTPDGVVALLLQRGRRHRQVKAEASPNQDQERRSLLISHPAVASLARRMNAPLHLDGRWAIGWWGSCTAAWPTGSPIRSSWPGRPPNQASRGVQPPGDTGHLACPGPVVQVGTDAARSSAIGRQVSSAG